jgi:hypothetical protein
MDRQVETASSLPGMAEFVLAEFVLAEFVLAEIVRL